MDRLNRWLALVANIGVLIGVIFVAIELQQSTAVSTAQAVFQINASVDSALRSQARDPNLARLIFSGHANPDSLTPVEKQQFDVWLRADMNLLESAWFYYENGLIPEAEFGGYRAAICDRMSTNGGRRHWETEGRNLASGFRSSIEDWCF